MTEYDFSPEAYQRHVANMQRISRWVDQTEHNRSRFADAAALTTPHPMENPHRRESPQRRPPPLHLPPPGQSYPYPIPPPSIYSSSSEDFVYSGGPRSPGPMPMSMYQQPPVPAHGPMMSPHTPRTLSSPNSSLRSHMFSHGHGYLMPTPPPFNPYSAMAPGYVIVPQGKARKGRSSRRRRSKSGSRDVSSSITHLSPLYSRICVFPQYY
jgi:hypothetical protein